jgi:hypothetical protein
MNNLLHRSCFAVFALLFTATSSRADLIQLVNGGFEEPAFGAGSNSYPTTIPGWQTTDRSFEIWGSGFLGVPAYEGIQFAELNAFVFGTLYQDLTGIAAGTLLGFETAHRGRAGVDTMNLTISDLGADNALGGAGSNADTILFSKNYSDGTDAWGFYTSATESAIIAQGNTTRYAFTAVSAVGGSSVGNFLDGVAFGQGVAGAGTSVPDGGSTVGLLALAMAACGVAARRSRVAPGR